MFFPNLTSIDGTLYADGYPLGKLKLIEHGTLPKMLGNPKEGEYAPTFSPIVYVFNSPVNGFQWFYLQ